MLRFIRSSVTPAARTYVSTKRSVYAVLDALGEPAPNPMDAARIEDSISNAKVDVKALREHARKQPWPISQKRMYELGKTTSTENLLIASNYLHRELPVRLARLTLLLDSMPYNLPNHPLVQRVRRSYACSFQSVVDLPEPKSEEDNRRMLQVLKDVNLRHTYGNYLAAAVQDSIENAVCTSDELDLKVFFDRFYTLRIGVRLLIDHFVALHEPIPGHVGIVEPYWSPAEAVEVMGQYTHKLCMQQIGRAPELQVRGNKDITLQVVSRHMRRIIFALLKNSYIAVVRKHKGNDLPPIQAVISGGSQDVTIKISDVGGGIPRSAMKKIWSWYYTTNNPVRLDKLNRDADLLVPTTIDFDKGFGFGLPLSRLCARYFGGDVYLVSMEGYGTDAYIYLNRFEEHERLMPVDDSKMPDHYPH